MKNDTKTLLTLPKRLTPDQIVDAVEKFVEENGHFPKTIKGKEQTYEYKIRIKYNNMVREKNMSIFQSNNPDLYTRIWNLELIKPSKLVSDAERITQFEAFYETYNRKPVATREQVSKEEYKLARSYDIEFSSGGKRRIRLSPELEKRLSDLERRPGWKIKSTTDELIARLVSFCETNSWFPQRNSPDSQERTLAQGIAQKSRFTKEQNVVIKELRSRYGRNENVSFPEKIFCVALMTLLGDNVVANRKICGHEADIAFPYKGCYYIVQYDGRYYHRNKECEQNDRAANAAHIAAKNKIIRLREKDLPTLNDQNQFEENEYIEIMIDPNCFSQENIEIVLRMIFEYIDCDKEIVISSIWTDILSQARYESGSRKTAITAVCEYLEYILLTEDVPSRSSQCADNSGARLDRRIKSLLNRNCFRETELEALALLEAFYEPDKRKRNQKKFESIGKKLDYNKGSQCISAKHMG